ncbi:MAG: putative C-S lyase [Chlorobi bacterium]|nr:putative C-S lyase [Chlorobiota bacterium]
MFDFDKIINREYTASVKYDLRQAYFGKADVLPMWVADMDFETPEFIRNAVMERAKHPVYGYSIRPDDYYQSIVGWLDRRINWKIEKDWILYSPGIVPAINFTVQTFTEPGDGVIVQPPVYFPFFNAIKNNKRKQILNPLIRKDGRYYFDFEDLEKKAGQARLLLLSSPHNPVGRCWQKEELEQLAAICIKNNVLILSDEIHGDLILPGFKHTPMASISEEIARHTITCIAPSKTFNLAGLATSSVIISNKELREAFDRALERLHISNGNIFGTVASMAGYNNGDVWLEELMQYIRNNFDYLKDALDNDFEMLDVTPLEATYLAWIDFRKTGLKDKEIKDKLIHEAGLGLSHGPLFGRGGEGFQRMNLAAPLSVIEEAVTRLGEVFH